MVYRSVTTKEDHVGTGLRRNGSPSRLRVDRCILGSPCRGIEAAAGDRAWQHLGTGEQGCQNCMTGKGNGTKVGRQRFVLDVWQHGAQVAGVHGVGRRCVGQRHLVLDMRRRTPPAGLYHAVSPLGVYGAVGMGSQLPSPSGRCPE